MLDSDVDDGPPMAAAVYRNYAAKACSCDNGPAVIDTGDIDDSPTTSVSYISGKSVPLPATSPPPGEFTV